MEKSKVEQTCSSYAVISVLKEPCSETKAWLFKVENPVDPNHALFSLEGTLKSTEARTKIFKRKQCNVPDESKWKWILTDNVKNEQFHSICSGKKKKKRQEFSFLSFGSIQMDNTGNNSLKLVPPFPSVKDSPLSLFLSMNKGNPNSLYNIPT